MEHNELCQAELKRCQSGSQSTGESSSKSGRYQRQLSQMSDYVSDQYFESGQVHIYLRDFNKCPSIINGELSPVEISGQEIGGGRQEL